MRAAVRLRGLGWGRPEWAADHAAAAEPRDFKNRRSEPFRAAAPGGGGASASTRRDRRHCRQAQVRVIE
jgi:hypothetical protein